MEVAIGLSRTADITETFWWYKQPSKTQVFRSESKESVVFQDD